MPMKNKRLEFVEVSGSVVMSIRKAVSSLTLNTTLADDLFVDAAEGEYYPFVETEDQLIDQTLTFVVTWIEKSITHLKYLNAMDTLHLPYRRYCIAVGFKGEHINIQPTLLGERLGKQERDGEMMLYVARVSPSHFRVYYHDDQSWRRWIQRLEKIAQTPIEELIRDGTIELE